MSNDNFFRTTEMSAARKAWKTYMSHRVRTDLTVAESEFLRKSCDGQRKRFYAAKNINSLTGC